MTILDAEMRDILATLGERGGHAQVDRMGRVICAGSAVEVSAGTWLRLVAEGWLAGDHADGVRLTQAGRTAAARCREMKARALAQGRQQG